MLKIILPVWEDNQKLYNLRLSDFVDEITEEGIRLFENNENAQEYIGRKVTSKNLYDTVVGTGNVQIQLYKIEEQREQQINWNQVARNSGVEGFLSAFVILSSLLDYMRKEDSDIFMDKNEGKVLLMDNPFSRFCSLGPPFSGLFFGWRRLEFPVRKHVDLAEDFGMTEEFKDKRVEQIKRI